MQDKEEFVEIIKKNEGIIYKIARTFTSELEDQKDLYQEIVFQLWKSFGSFRKDAKMSTWIYRVALNTSLSFSRSQKKKRLQSSLDFDVVDARDDSSELMNERIDLLYAHIKLLTTIEKGIVLLYFEGKSHSEISEITGFSVSNIGTRISRIKAKLKSQMIKS